MERRKGEMHEQSASPIERPLAVRTSISGAGSSTQGNIARAVYSAKFYNDLARIQREMGEEDARLVKPFRGDRLIASNTRAYGRADIEAVQGADKVIEKR